MGRSLPIVIVIALAALGAEAQEAMPVQVVAKIKDATTYLRTHVESETDGAVTSGSGFVIRTDATTGYIVTNAHVVTQSHDENKFSRTPTTTVFFRSGTKAESSAVAEIIAQSSERDLALLRVSNVANLPAPIDFSAEAEPFETMTVYIFGFPFGERLAVGKRNPPVNVGRGQVSSIRRDEDDRLTSVLLDGALNPGNSGGPVVDAKGRLVGISRATIRGANIGFAIAIPELLEMLNGGTAGSSLRVAPVKDHPEEVRFDVALVDPLNRIKSARLLYTRGAAKFSKKQRPKPAERPAESQRDREKNEAAAAAENRGEEFVFGPLEGAETVDLTVAGLRASGTLKLPKSDKDVVLWCQVSFVDAAGAPRYLKPRQCLMGAPRGGNSAPLSGSGTFWGEVVDPDGDCSLRIDDGDVICEVPGTLHDLNIDISKNNGPRVVQEVEGDFVATVKVAGSFDPGPERTGPKSVPYNGGGLLVWHDEGNYIRLERASMYRNNRVVGFLDFESREEGTRAEVHNKGGLNPKRDLWLRVERRGKAIHGFLSNDGHDWEELQPMNVDWPPRLQVGVDAINSCGDPMTVRFHEYALKPQSDRSATGDR